MPILSIIIPLYNCESYIDEAIGSVLNQDFSDFELIIVNDGSTDHSCDIAKQYLRDPRIKLISQGNKGLLHARAAGLRIAQGEYCMFLDADDVLQRHALSGLQEHMQKGYDCIIYNLGTFQDGALSKIKPLQFAFRDLTEFQEKDKPYLIELLFTSGSINSIVCKAFRRNLICVQEMEQLPRIAIGEDGLYTLNLLEHANTFLCLNRVLYFYRMNYSSMTHKLKYSIFTDNMFRFRLYREKAIQYFTGIELERVINGIYLIETQMTIALSLRKRYAVRGYDEYTDVLEEISDDAGFADLIQHIHIIPNAAFRFVLRLLAKKKYRLLYLFRMIIGNL